MTDGTQSKTKNAKRPDPKVAEQALAEAAERRKKSAELAKSEDKELYGREGPDPARYGDWENKGIASDF